MAGGDTRQGIIVAWTGYLKDKEPVSRARQLQSLKSTPVVNGKRRKKINDFFSPQTFKSKIYFILTWRFFRWGLNFCNQLSFEWYCSIGPRMPVMCFGYGAMLLSLSRSLQTFFAPPPPPRLPLHGRPITRMITERTGLHLVLLPLSTNKNISVTAINNWFTQLKA